MQCPDCKTLIVHTYGTKLIEGDNVNAQYRYNICENQHRFPTVELVGRRKSKDAKTIAIELSTQYTGLIEYVD